MRPKLADGTNKVCIDRDTFSGDAQNRGKNPSLQEKKHQYLDRYFKRVK